MAQMKLVIMTVCSTAVMIMRSPRGRVRPVRRAPTPSRGSMASAAPMARRAEKAIGSMSAHFTAMPERLQSMAAARTRRMPVARLPEAGVAGAGS